MKRKVSAEEHRSTSPVASAVVTSNYSVYPSDRERAPPSKLRRGGARIISALKSLTNSGSEKSIVEHMAYLPSPPPSPKGKSTRGDGLVKVSSSLNRAPFEPTVIRRSPPKERPSILSLHSMETLAVHPIGPSNSPGSSANSNSNSNGNSAKSPNDSTGQTSLDSKFGKDKDQTGSSTEKKHHAIPQHTTSNNGNGSNGRRATAVHVTKRSSPDGNLTPIQETALDQATPSIVTVERAAAAKIYFETHFNELLGGGPSARSIRRRLLEADLYKLISGDGAGDGSSEFTADDIDFVRWQFYRRESDHLREVRGMKARSIGALAATGRSRSAGCLLDAYENVKILGKGSFGIVRLVREKSTASGTGQACQGHGEHGKTTKQVYAMKVIRKSDMLRTSQEGHLRAERDFLVASEGSNWIVPLISSFQDASHLYLVMEYMPGGDFLGLLIRENILHETVARFYIAEMIVCVEEAHALKCIHRDIKPDNFLISASGHLKISDFGLAFDGHWSHDIAYFNNHRYSLLHKLGINIEGDERDKKDGRKVQEQLMRASGVMAGMDKHEKRDKDNTEPLLHWRNRCGNRTSAMSIVGTSQYMAPEVVAGKPYDARCDWWSIGVILYECLYGHTPFLSEEGRQMTKQNILRHKETFGFPEQPLVSRRCQELIVLLLQDRSNRLCSKRYRFKDLCTASRSLSAVNSPTPTNVGNACEPDRVESSAQHHLKGSRDFAGRYVFPYDAEDIKAHRWFKNVPWDRLHELQPPFVPAIRAVDDTQYFDEDDEISEWSESEQTEESLALNLATSITPGPPTSPTLFIPPMMNGGLSNTNPEHELNSRLAHNPHAVPEPLKLATKGEEAKAALHNLRRSVQKWALQAVAHPYDSTRLRAIDGQIDAWPDLAIQERALLRQWVRVYGHRERKRPRDRLLRDRNTKQVVLELRKKTAFLGYTWRRIRPPLPARPPLGAVFGNEVVNGAVQEGTSGAYGGYDGCGGAGCGPFAGEENWENVPAIRALHRGWMTR